MPLLVFFAFLGGIVTILSPCILPVLPIVLSGSVSKLRPLAITTGFVMSFTFFTLFLTAIVKAFGIAPDAFRFLAIVIIAFFGLSLALEIELFKPVTAPKTTNSFLLGSSLGLVWVPCVGPILAAIIALAATQTVGFDALVITLVYSVGTAIPMFIILLGGRRFIKTTPHVQKIFGILMIITAAAMYFNWDRQFQAYILAKFPNYGAGLTKLEDNASVRIELEKLKSAPRVSISNMLESTYGNAPELIPGGQWFNTKPLTLQELRGKVILLDFWTYTCINCIRTLPYLKNWYTKYKDKGFVIIGVHTPEFEFEKDPKNVAKAIKDFGLEYPIMQDNEYETWNAYNNRYWPAKYFIDKNGKIRFTHFGEGNYDESEQRIVALLAETGVTTREPISNPEYQINARTPETYLGALRGDYSRISTTGTWSKSDEYAMPKVESTLTLKFDAAKVYLVMRGKGKIKVFLDDKLVQTVTVDGDKLYQLIDLQESGQHSLKLEFLDDTIELYAFTFG